MGLLIDSTLDFAPETATPATPSTGAKLWVYTDGTLRLTSVGGVTAKVMTDANRPPAIWFTTETGAPVLPTNTLSPLYGQDVVVNDWIVRDSDGEVFKYTGSAVTDQARSIGQGNAQASTVASGYRTGAASYSAGNNRINIDTKAFDPGACLDVTTNYCYTAPVAGFYHVSGQVRPLYPTSGTEAGLFIAPPGSPSQTLIDGDYQYTEAANTYPSLSVDGIIQLAAGQQISLWSYGSSAYSLYVGNGASDNFLSVTLVAPLSAAPMQPNTGSRAYRNAAYTMPTGWNVVPVDTIATGDDPGGHINLTNHQYVVASPGMYDCSGNVIQNMAAGALANIGVYKNGVLASVGEANSNAEASGTTFGLMFSDKIRCVAGDLLDLRVYNGSAAALSVGQSYQNYFSVVKVDQPVPDPSNTGWFTPTFLNSWSGNVQYMKDALGFVHFKGAISGGSSNTQAFLLPVGFRPGTAGNRPVVSNGSTASPSYVYMDYNGQVVPVYPSGTGTSYFDGIAPYLAEN
jgi:hypothetical protein